MYQFIQPFTSKLCVAIIIFLCCGACKCQLQFKKGAPHVKCESGNYIGSVKDSRGGLPYYEFLGLRYAHKPERFKPAKLYLGESPGEPFHLANTPPQKCPQQFGDIVMGDEDCLFLNIHVPMRPPPNKDGFPVMVMIHGGAFAWGSGHTYEPMYFMDEDVILITINYRLGALGFLSTEDEVVPGNMGLKDMLLSLKWVQKNIESFGGDKKSVTIFGNSAGGASVHYLILHPHSPRLFHSAIAQSGSAHNLWAFSHNPASAAQEFGQLLKCSTESSQALLDCMNGKSIAEILSAQALMKRWYIDPIAAFAPTIEFYKDDSTFLSEYPDEIIERREFARVPLMLGVTQDEGLSIHAVSVILNEKLTNQIDSDFETIAPITFNFRKWFPTSVLKTMSKEIRKFYFGTKSINRATLANLTNLYSDANFVHGVWKFALEHATEQPVYPYIITFDDESSQSLTKLFTNSDEKFGVAHGDETQYLFKSLLFAEEPAPKSEAEIFSKRLVKLWASFATHRKPTEMWGSSMDWPPISKAQLQGDQPFKWYQLDKDTRLLEDPFLKRKQFWDKLFRKYSKRHGKDEL